VTLAELWVTVTLMKGSVWQALTVAGVLTAVCAGAAFAANTTSFFDPGADSDSAPDITGVAITNDDAGVVTVKLTLANRPVVPAATDDFAVGIDADQNPDTGSVFYGAEYELDLDRGVIAVWRESPNGFYTQAIAPPSLHIIFASGAVTFSFKASELGITSGFNLYTLGADSNGLDAAPDMRTANYQFVGGSAAPLLGRDTRAPLTQALKSAGVHGKAVRLAYFAGDGRGETADTIVVYRGKKVLKRINYAIEDTSPFLTYSARWNVPKKTRGKLRFCVTSTDRAGNESKTSCAALTIK
jgi:hypothetical protein